MKYKVKIKDENNIVLNRDDSIYIYLSKVDTKISPVVGYDYFDKKKDSINQLYMKNFELRADSANWRTREWPEIKHDLDTSFLLMDINRDVDKYLDSLKNK